MPFADNLAILHDVHIGFNRVIGTTVASREHVRAHLHVWFSKTLGTIETNLLMAGDLFDDFTVETRDFLFCLKELRSWCIRNPHRVLYLMAGNHDWSDKGHKLSSFGLLCSILSLELSNVKVIEPNTVSKIDRVGGAVWCVSHHSDQESFTKVLETLATGAEVQPGDFIMLHANFDNKFAARSDHSLNVTMDMARKFTDAGVKLLFAHEHQHRKALGGKLYIPGNHWPTSVADCLGNDTKHHISLEDDKIVIHPTWAASSTDTGFREIDWQELDMEIGFTGFLRVTGKAKREEASAVIDALSRFRQKSPALVVVNSTHIDGVVQDEAELDDLRIGVKFDMRGFVAERLSPEQMVTFDRLLKIAKGV